MSATTRALRRLVFDGHLSTSAADRTRAATDFGGIHHRRPLAVLRPQSIADISRIVTFARDSGLRVAARGRGHSCCGQAQCEDGVVVDMSTMSQVTVVGRNALDAEAGATWKDVLNVSLPTRAMPPVLPDFLGLSVGGLIALGGIGYQTCRYGAVIDHVTHLTVVTGTGEVVECSAKAYADLFRAVRGGLGQFGIVVSVRLRLVAAPPLIRFSRYLYADLVTLLADMRRLSRTQTPRFDTICAFGIPNQPAILADVMGDIGKGLYFPPWITQRLFVLQVGEYCRSDRSKDHGYVSDELRCVPHVRHTWTDRFSEFADRASAHLAHWKSSGLWHAPHPWLSVIVPGSAAGAWLSRAIEALDPFDPADGPIMIYPVVRRDAPPSMLQSPATAYALRMEVLRSAPPNGRRSVGALMRANRRALASCSAVGGVHYPSSALNMRPSDWRRHFGRHWSAFEALRQRYDPDRVLTPGQGIVTSTPHRGSSVRAAATGRRQTPRSARR